MKLELECSAFFVDKLREFSTAADLPESVVVENLVLMYLADKEAFRQMYKDDPRILAEFIGSGEEFYNCEVGNRVLWYEQQEEDHMLEILNSGGKLEPEQKAWLEQRLTKWTSDKDFQELLDHENRLRKARGVPTEEEPNQRSKDYRD
jgi:vacuolar-type H+-ATPase subunit C/Vma6